MFKEKYIQLWIAIGSLTISAIVFGSNLNTSFEKHCISSKDAFNVHCDQQATDFSRVEKALDKMDEKLDVIHEILIERN